MLKRIFLCLFTALSFIFISCEIFGDCTKKEIRMLGKSIANYPKWTKRILVSDWKPWNTEETAEFRKLFKQKESLNSDKNINYRLFIEGQNLVVII